MWSSKSYLDLCQDLMRVGLIPDFEPGDRLARGYADLGYEEYILLTNNRLLSLFTGKITSLEQVGKEHLFSVPDVDRCIDLIHRQGWKVISLSTLDHRSWSLEIAPEHGAVQGEIVECLTDNSVELVLARALHLILQFKKNNE